MKYTLILGIGFPETGIWTSEGHLETIWGLVLEVDSGSNSGQFWVISEVNLRPILGNLIILLRIALIWPWVGPWP